MTNFSKCVGCGYCCWVAQCSLSLHLYDKRDICPDLYWDNNLKRHFCKQAKEYAEVLYIEAGCSSSLNSWRRNVRDRT